MAIIITPLSQRTRKKVRAITKSLSVVVLSACASNSTRLYNLPAYDPGKHQSPINILTKATRQELAHHHFVVHSKDSIKTIENLGHTIQLDFSQANFVTFDGIEYHLNQMHFHTPSEHHIDGMTYPMELHIVSEDGNAQKPGYLVIGVLFKMGQANRFIEKFLKQIPDKHQTSSVIRHKPQLNDLLPVDNSENLGHFFHYQGSLTTPPYSENVQWIVLKTIFEASPQQIDTINSIEGDNARNIEAQNNRVVDEE